MKGQLIVEETSHSMNLEVQVIGWWKETQWSEELYQSVSHADV